MSLNSSFVGRSYPPTPPYTVSREKIQEFAQAIGATDRVYWNRDAAIACGYPDVIAPPTFLIVLTMAAGDQLIHDPELGMDFSRVVHGNQRFLYKRPIHAGDQLTCVCAVDEITARGGNSFLTMRTEVSDNHGDVVATAWAKLVVRGLGYSENREKSYATG